MKIALNETEEKVYAYILGYLADFDYPPMELEIKHKFDFTKQRASFILKNLQRKGFIKKGGLHQRGIKLTAK